MRCVAYIVAALVTVSVELQTGPSSVTLTKQKTGSNVTLAPPSGFGITVSTGDRVVFSISEISESTNAAKVTARCREKQNVFQRVGSAIGLGGGPKEHDDIVDRPYKLTFQLHFTAAGPPQNPAELDFEVPGYAEATGRRDVSFIVPEEGVVTLKPFSWDAQVKQLEDDQKGRCPNEETISGPTVIDSTDKGVTLKYFICRAAAHGSGPTPCEVPR